MGLMPDAAVPKQHDAPRHPDGGPPEVKAPLTSPESGPQIVESGAAVLNDIRAFVSRFVIYPSAHTEIAHVLWVAHTHLMDRWDSTPRIAFLSAEPASGKTRALEVSELLVPNPVVAVNMTAAYLFRKVGSDPGATILYDEIDTVFGPKAKENEDIRALLNAGYRRGATAGRCSVRGTDVIPEDIPAYAAVALAGLGWLPDTILSRAVIIRMAKRKSGERVEPFRRRLHAEEGHAIRDRLARWAASLPATDWPVMPQGIEDRDADIWEPLLAVADAAGGEWPELARVAAVALVTSAREAEPSLGVLLLAHSKTAFEAKGMPSEMTTEDILAALHAMPEAPWSDLKGKQLNERELARRLRQYDVKPTVLGGGRRRGYKRDDLHDPWERYLPAPLPPAGSVTSVTDVTEKHTGKLKTLTDVTHVTAVEYGDGKVCSHCGRPGNLYPTAYGDYTTVLHPGCRDAWMAAQNDLTIPLFLDRRLR